MIKIKNSPAPESILGRKRNADRDIDILEATITVLAEVGYDGLSMGKVAECAQAGKGTMYRRWPSKVDLVLDAVSHMKAQQINLEALPDTGSLRDDLLSLFHHKDPSQVDRTMRAMAGVISMISQVPGLAEKGDYSIFEPWIRANYVLMERARMREEIPASADIILAAQIIPSMAAYRALILRTAIDRDLVINLIDRVVLPSLNNATE
ncbi:TetR family transcriptional regulator [Enterobacteriaceae bacterium RIT697]|uniref:TetR/AcrR family transcriptional regulator n=1 Tax=Pantoea endophytica TaxID=92488 RepID=UPI0012ADE8FA|nr:TetR/AcrR family transcriptional regulator [Pantoea endophytica]MRT24996.1 TetR family transcriptional regulator [Enterobacteriaceae bacterium RIT697]